MLCTGKTNSLDLRPHAHHATVGRLAVLRYGGVNNAAKNGRLVLAHQQFGLAETALELAVRANAPVGYGLFVVKLPLDFQLVVLGVDGHTVFVGELVFAFAEQHL